MRRRRPHKTRSISVLLNCGDALLNFFPSRKVTRRGNLLSYYARILSERKGRGNPTETQAVKLAVAHTKKRRGRDGAARTLPPYTTPTFGHDARKLDKRIAKKAAQPFRRKARGPLRRKAAGKNEVRPRRG